jgi:hypothetical protein
MKILSNNSMKNFIRIQFDVCLFWYPEPACRQAGGQKLQPRVEGVLIQEIIFSKKIICNL